MDEPFGAGVGAVAPYVRRGGPSLTRRVRRHGENDWRSEPTPRWLPPDLDPKRDLAEQLLGKRFGLATVTGATGSRGTSAVGTDVYNLELDLKISHPFPADLRRLKSYVASYQVNLRVKVSMRIRSSED